MIEEIDKHRWRAKEEKDLPTLRYNNYNYVKALISKNPQSVVKIIGYREGAKETRNTLEYIARAGKEDELELEDENGLKIKGKDAIAGLVNEWAEDFDEINEDSKRKNRDSTHMMLSADIEPNEKNKEILENVAREFLRREFFDKGFSYTFVAHIDTQHPHIHVVIKNRPIMMEIKKGVWKNRKLELNPNDLEHLREQFAIEMQKKGLEQVVTLRKDDPNKHLEDIRKRLFGDKFKNYKGIKEKIEWYQAKLQEKDWKFEDKNIRQYSAYLQMELMRVKEQIKKSKISISEKTKLNIEHRELMKALDLARKNQEAEQLKQMVQNFKDKTLDKVEQYQKRNMTLVELLEKNIESYQSVKKEAGLKIEEKLIKIKEKLQSDFPSLSVKDAQYLGIDTSNLITFTKKISHKEKVLVSDIKASKDIYEEVDKSYEMEMVDLKSLDLKNINLNQDISKLKDEITLRQKANKISKTLINITKQLDKQKENLTENQYNFLQKRITKIQEKLISDFPSLSVKDAEFLGINTLNLDKFEQQINYKEKILASDLSTKKEFVVEEKEKNFTVENINLSNLNLKDIEFKENGISEYFNKSNKALAISKGIDSLIQAVDIELTNNHISATHCYKQQEKLLNIKKRLESDFQSLSVKDAQFLGIDTSNLPKLEKFELKKEDGSIFVIENIDLEKLDLEKLSKNIDIDYKQEIIKLKSLDIQNLKDDKYFDKYSTASQKAIENKDLNSFDELQNLYKVDSSITVKAYGEILNISPREVNISLWEKLGENRESYDLESLKLIIEVQNKDYQKEFVNIYIDKLKTEYALQKEMPENEHELESYFKSLDNFEKLCDQFKIEFNENKEKLENFNNIKHLLATGQFVSANKLLNSLDEFDRLALKSYYENAIDIHSQNFDEMDIIKNKIDFEAELRDKEYIISSEFGEELPISNTKKIDVETVKFEHPFDKVEIDFEVEDKKDIEIAPGEIFDFNKAITIERNAELFRQIINEKEKLTQDDKILQKLEEIKIYINKANPNLSINDAKFLGVDTNNFEKYTKEISYKVFDFSSSQDMKKEFEEFTKSFPDFSKNILTEAINKQEISFEKLELIGIKPIQFKNISKDDFTNKKIDLKNNTELLKEFNELSKKFPELAKNELTKSFEKGNITTGRLSKYGMTPEKFKNFKDTQISDKTVKIDFVDFEKNNIYKKDFKFVIPGEQEIKITNNIKNIKAFTLEKSDFFKEKDLNLIKEDDLNLYNLKHLKALENSEIGYFTVKSTSSKMLQAQAGLTSLLSQANAIEKSFDEVDKSKVSIIEKIDHKKILKNLKKDFIENIAKLSKDAEVILDNSLLIQKNKDVEFENKYINEGLKNFSDNPKKLDDAYVKECKKQNNFNIDYEEFKKVFLKNELKEDKKSLNTTLENYKYTLEKSLKVINKELGIFDRAKSSVVIKEQLKKIDKILSKGIEF